MWPSATRTERRVQRRSALPHRTRSPGPRARPEHVSTGDAGVAQAEAAGLRPDAQTVRLHADGDLREEVPVLRRERVDAAAVTAGEPQHLAVRGDAAHVRTTAAGDVPGGDLAVVGEVDDGDAAAAAVRDVEIAT